MITRSRIDLLFDCKYGAKESLYFINFTYTVYNMGFAFYPNILYLVNKANYRNTCDTSQKIPYV
jgi:hypothetical protein